MARDYTLVALELTTANGQQNRGLDYIPGQILVQFHPAAPAARRNNALRGGPARCGTSPRSMLIPCNWNPARPIEAALAARRGDPDVLLAQPDYLRTAVTSGPPNDPLWLN